MLKSQDEKTKQFQEGICHIVNDTMYYLLDEDDSKCLAENLYNADYRKVEQGEWEWFEEWSPSTSEHPRECDECGWRCGKCKEALIDMVGGYWDDPEDKPQLKFCPNCGADMRGGDDV